MGGPLWLATVKHVTIVYVHTYKIGGGIVIAVMFIGILSVPIG